MSPAEKKRLLLARIEANRSRVGELAEQSMPAFRVLDIGYQTVRFVRAQPFLATALSAIATRIFIGNKARRPVSFFQRVKLALRWPTRLYALYQLATRAQAFYSYGSKMSALMDALLDDEFRIRTGTNRPSAEPVERKAQD